MMLQEPRQEVQKLKVQVSNTSPQAASHKDQVSMQA